MACQNIERIYNEIIEKRRSELIEEKKKAEEKRRQAEEKINRIVKKLLQAGESVDYVSELTGMSEEDVMALLER